MAEQVGILEAKRRAQDKALALSVKAYDASKRATDLTGRARHAEPHLHADAVDAHDAARYAHKLAADAWQRVPGTFVEDARHNAAAHRTQAEFHADTADWHHEQAKTAPKAARTAKEASPPPKARMTFEERARSYYASQAGKDAALKDKVKPEHMIGTPQRGPRGGTFIMTGYGKVYLPNPKGR